MTPASERDAALDALPPSVVENYEWRATGKLAEDAISTGETFRALGGRVTSVDNERQVIWFDYPESS